MSQHWVTLTRSDLEVEMKVYKEEIMCGLREKSLSFPNLDKETTINAMVNTEAVRPNPMMRQNLSDTNKDDEAKTFEIFDSESLASTSTDSRMLTDIGEDYIYVAKYDKLAIFLEGRVKRL
ncbi:hypothetical protein RJT34_30694 [Clitoria ternatea]|uniref:Uncharacterized protein n=1 Tax=Clitoria ternatea TaxID=43366 RepID=A0AAN9I2V9_CLITE